MNKNTYTDQEIIDYLLGNLSAVRTEEFDELSFTDDEFADALKITEKDLIDSYVNQELKGEDLEKFKTNFLISPLRREKIEFAKTFQIFGQNEIAEKNTEIVSKDKVGLFSSLLLFFRPARQWSFALGGLILLILGIWLGVRVFRQNSAVEKVQINRQNDSKRDESQIIKQPADNSTSQKETEKTEEKQILPNDSENLPEQKRTPAPERKVEEKKPQTPPRKSEPELAQAKKKEGQGIGYGSPAKILSFLLLPPLRGGNQLKNLSIPSKVNLVNLRLQLEIDEFSTYRAVLQDPADNRTLDQIRTKAKNKILNFQIPARLLQSQIYLIEVSGIKPDGTAEIIGNYSFKVVK